MRSTACVKLAPGPMIAIKPAKAHGAAVLVDLAALWATAPSQRAKWLEDATDQTLTGAALTALAAATKSS